VRTIYGGRMHPEVATDERVTRRTALLSLGTFLIAACAPGPSPVSRSPHDPSNPNATEGVTPSATATASSVAAAGTGPGDVHAGHGAPVSPTAPNTSAATSDGGVTLYDCPMHPEVTSQRPGSCPECGMTLVPKK
jgi:hypothetical protein